MAKRGHLEKSLKVNKTLFQGFLEQEKPHPQLTHEIFVCQHPRPWGRKNKLSLRRLIEKDSMSLLLVQETINACISLIP